VNQNQKPPSNVCIDGERDVAIGNANLVLTRLLDRVLHENSAFAPTESPPFCTAVASSPVQPTLHFAPTKLRTF
jgi:hypothetical protein